MIAEQFLAYLRNTHGEVDYSEPLKPLAGGFVTDVYSFSLDRAPPEWSGPLVLRVYPQAVDALGIRRERCAQEVVSAQGVPAPRVLVCEDTASSLDRAFMVMERLPGRMQLAIDFPRVLIEVPRLFAVHRRHAAAMHMVHELDAAPLLAAFEAAGIDRRSAGPDHWLDGSEATIRRRNFVGLEAGLAWLRANRPPDPARLSINHGDFFGGNILESRGRITGILDWNLATVGDHAIDLGGQIAAAEMSPVEAPRFIQLIATGIGQLLARGLRRAYPGFDDVSPDAVRYYAVMRAFTELVFKLDMLAHQRETGEKVRMPTWRPKQCARYFLDRTGVRVEL